MYRIIIHEHIPLMYAEGYYATVEHVSLKANQWKIETPLYKHESSARRSAKTACKKLGLKQKELRT